jgi:hypothetical protein
MTITVNIGPDGPVASRNGTFKRTYHVKVTSAPVAYDSGNTIRGPRTYSAKGLDGHLVLIADFDLGWHEGRYGSGLHWLDDPDDLFDADNVVDYLVKKLHTAEGA